MRKLNQYVDVKAALVGGALFYVGFRLGRNYEIEIKKVVK